MENTKVHLKATIENVENTKVLLAAPIENVENAKVPHTSLSIENTKVVQY